MAEKLENILALLDKYYPPETAEEWDRVGLIVGDPQAEITKIGFAVDPCQSTVEEALDKQAQLLITHHPLYLRGTSSVAVTNAKGRWVTQLIRGGCALFAAHTNADAAPDGSATALANLLELQNQRPLVPYVNSAIGLGKIGDLPMSMSVREVAERLKALLPPTPAGITIGGDAERIVKRVALSPGSGDSFLAAVRESEADVYITADLRHHPATDHLWDGGCPLIGLTHFASEWPLLPALQKRIAENFAVETYISILQTDPWSMRI